MESPQNQMLDGITFIGNALGPLFYHDPKDKKIEATYVAFANLNVDNAIAEWPYISDATDEAKDALQLMINGASEGINDDLVWEYRRLFVGPAAKAAPPWGSVYTDRECVVFGESTLELRHWMKQNGIANLCDEKEPEDHIGLMLMLLSWISTNSSDLVDEYLTDHLLTWAPHFLEEMEEEAKHPFYVGLARLTRVSLEGIRSGRALTIKHPHYYR